jgi:hypothetical protein
MAAYVQMHARRAEKKQEKKLGAVFYRNGSLSERPDRLSLRQRSSFQLEKRQPNNILNSIVDFRKGYYLDRNINSAYF